MHLYSFSIDELAIENIEMKKIYLYLLFDEIFIIRFSFSFKNIHLLLEK